MIVTATAAWKGVGIDVGRVHHMKIIGHVRTVGDPVQSRTHTRHIGIQGGILGLAVVGRKLIEGDTGKYFGGVINLVFVVA